MLYSLIAASISVLPLGSIDLQSPQILISAATRAEIAGGSVADLTCIDVSHRSARIDQVCLSERELSAAYDLALREARYGRNLRAGLQAEYQNWRSRN